MTVIEKEGKWFNLFWNAESQIKKAEWYGFEINKDPHLESYAKIGLYLCHFDTQHEIYGKWVIGIHYGKYLLEFSLKEGFSFHKDYLDIDSFVDDEIPNASPGEYE